MPKIVAVLVAAFFMCAPAQAADSFKFRLVGTLTGQIDSAGDPDPNLAVGDQLVVTARVSPYWISKDDGRGYDIAAFYDDPFVLGALPTAGPDYFRIDAPGMTWRATDNELDYLPAWDGTEWALLGPPAIAFKGGKILGIVGVLYPASNSDRPMLDMGWGFDFAPDFAIRPPLGNYNNNYPSPGFTGLWDFAGSSVSVPEPSQWALLIAGFGLVGGAMRRRRHLAPMLMAR